MKLDWRRSKHENFRCQDQLPDVQRMFSLTIWNQNDGCVARVTTCLVDHSLREDEAYVDANNCPWAVAFLEKNGFAKRTGKKRRSGYCEYPLMKFDTTKMLMYEEVR